ncbi:MAG: DUF998 domain-containing protein [Nitriliruptorales bacterium]|nr:DUF998 domain-containing protein [Nitriliruptorales bacterium]
MSARQLGVVGMIGAGWFIVSVLILNVIDTEYSRINDFMSDYANGEYGWLMQSAFLGAGIGAIATAGGLRKSLEPGKRVTASIVLLLVAGLGYLLAIAKTDPSDATEFTTAGILHVVGSLLIFFSLLIAVWFLRGVFDRDPSWNHLATTQMWFATAYTVTMVVSFGTPMDGPVGLTQRIFVPVMMAWWIFIAWNIRRLDSTSQAAEHQTAHA